MEDHPKDYANSKIQLSFTIFRRSHLINEETLEKRFSLSSEQVLFGEEMGATVLDSVRMRTYVQAMHFAIFSVFHLLLKGMPYK